MNAQTTSPFVNNYFDLRARCLSQLNDWPLYQSVLRHQIGQSVPSQTARLAGTLEQARMCRNDILAELVSIYESAPRAKRYYEQYPQEKLLLPDVYRFETVLRMHRNLLEIRNELAEGRPISMDKLEWMQKVVDETGWLSGNFGIQELASNINSALNFVLSRHSTPDLEKAGQILTRIAGTSMFHDTDLPTLPMRFAGRLLEGGIHVYAKFKRAEVVDDALLAQWAKSDIRRRIIPDIVKSSASNCFIPPQIFIRAMKIEWKHYNEYLLRQYDDELRARYPDILCNNYKYTDGDEDHSAIYNVTWGAYDMIYDLERAAISFGDSRVEMGTTGYDLAESELVRALRERFSFLSQLIEEYATRVKRGEEIHSRASTSTPLLSETPELEELFVLTNTLGALAPDGVGKDAYNFLGRLIEDTELNIRDRGYMLWRIEELFDTMTPLGHHEYVEFTRTVLDIIAMEPQIRRNLSDCQSFSELVARKWAAREVRSLISKIQDVEVPSSTRIMAIQRLRRWSAVAADALPVLAQFESSLPDGFDLENDPLSFGAHALFKKSNLTSTILTARAVHGHIKSSLEMRGWK